MRRLSSGNSVRTTPYEARKISSRTTGADGRGNIIKNDKYVILDDCYNASPKSVESAIDMLAKMPGRKVAILGDMLELGEKTDKLHFRVGKYAGQAGIDVIVCVGRRSEKTYMGARMSTDNQVELFETKDECIEALPSILKEGDAVLIKASNAMKFPDIVEAVRNM